MKVEIEVKFNIGDKVIVKNSTGNGLYMRGVDFPLKAIISGFVITKDNKRTTVNYFIEPIAEDVDRWQAYNLSKATSHRRRYPAKYLERIEE